MNYPKPILFLLLLILITISCDEKALPEPKGQTPAEKIVKTSLANERHLESVLNTAGFTNLFSKGISNGRKNSAGLEIDTETILKIVQADSIHYTYTFQIEDDFKENSFTNLVLQEIEGGYIGFTLQYESSGKFYDLSSFTGKLKRSDLEGNLISEKQLTNGHLYEDTNSISGGRTMQSSANCVKDINVKDVCTSWGYIHNYQNTQTTGFGCLEYETVIEIEIGSCPDSGGSGDPGAGGDTGGTSIPSSGGGSTSGGGSGNNGSGYNPSDNPDGGNTIVPIPIVVLPEDDAYDLRIQNFKTRLTSEQFLFVKKNQSITYSIYSYLESQVDDSTPYSTTYPEAAIEFGKWAIDYFKYHPGTSWEQFENWFVTPRESRDPLGYDAEYWENPDLYFPQQNLPTWTDFDSAYPRITGSELVPIIGGEVKAAYEKFPSLTRGSCALKLSRALNYAGVNIPKITTTAGSPGTVKGADGKYYFLNAKALNKWMRETFGTNPATTNTPLNANHHHFTSTQGGANGENYPTLTAGLKGIFSMVSTNSDWASGHADLIEDSECVFGCHFNDTPPAPIDYIDIWVLID